MIAILFAVFRASRGLQLMVLILACWGAWKGNSALQRALGRSEGRSEVTIAVQQKATENAATSEEVRGEVAAGKHGKPDPNRLRGKDRPGE